MAHYTIYTAIEVEDAEEVARFLEENDDFDINEQDPHGSTPLHKAVDNNALEVCQVLLDNGADINAQDDFGATPLHDDWSIARLLLKLGAKTDIPDDSGNTYLHQVIATDNVTSFSIILQRGIVPPLPIENKFMCSCYNRICVQLILMRVPKSVTSGMHVLEGGLMRYLCSFLYGVKYIM